MSPDAARVFGELGVPSQMVSVWGYRHERHIQTDASDLCFSPHTGVIQLN